MTKNITIGCLKALSQRRFQALRTKTPFLTLLRLAEDQEAGEMDVSIYHKGFLSLEEFWDCIDHIPLSKDYHLFDEKINKFRTDIYSKIPEQAMFATDAYNINAHIHIPYVNDGMHTHDHFEINYVYHGSCSLLFENESLCLTEGTLCILAPESSHNLMTENDTLVVAIMVRKSTFEKLFWNLLGRQNMLASFFRSSLYMGNRPNYLLFDTDNTVEQKHYVQQILMEAVWADEFSDGNSGNFLSLFFSSVLRKYENRARFYNFEEPLTRSFHFNVLMQYIISNYNHVTLQELADTFHYSISFLSKLIQNTMGKSFSEIVKELKLKHGKELLRDTDYSIAKITEMIGYESASYFSRAFKHAYGISPSVYRQNRNQSE